MRGWRSRLKKALELKLKPKMKVEKTERRRCARLQAVLIKPAEGVCYALILKDLKKQVNPEKLSVIVKDIREIHCKDLLVEIKCTA